jgi:AAA lid domain
MLRRSKESDQAQLLPVRNALERAQLQHASRLIAAQDRTWSRDDLMRIEAEDIFPGGVVSLDAGVALAE